MIHFEKCYEVKVEMQNLQTKSKLKTPLVKYRKDWINHQGGTIVYRMINGEYEYLERLK